MTVTAKPAVFTASDRREFETLAEAEAWEEVLADQAAYRDARRRWMRRIAVSNKTADGHTFEGMRRYYRVRDWFHSMPRLEECRIYESYLRLATDWDGEHTEQAVIRLPIYEYRTGSTHQQETGKTHDAPIAELYRDALPAKVALLAKQRQFIAQCQEEAAELAAEVEPRTPESDLEEDR